MSDRAQQRSDTLVELTTLIGVIGRCRPLLAAMTAVRAELNVPYGLPRDSVVDVTALVTVDKDDLDGLIGQVPDHLMQVVTKDCTGSSA
jgi:mRNA interferase MazF